MLNIAVRIAAYACLVALTTFAYADTIQDIITAAVRDASREEAARVRDMDRKPSEILEFSGIRRGNVVLEIAPGSGYYTALLSRVVGKNGHVYAVDPERVFAYFPDAREGFPDFMKADPRTNVTYSSQFLDEIHISKQVDQVWMILYYHDTIWTGEDRARMNKAFYDMLKPGGVYMIVDHHGLIGADDTITKDLHRMDADIARKEVEAAGFVLDATSDVLANPDDPRDDSVFTPERRGKTDRFVWRYRKPDKRS